MGFQRGGFNGPAGNMGGNMGGFGGPGPMNNFGGGPMGGMNNFGGGNFNRGAMMGGGMRGGMNNRGRGGMGMNNMGGMNMPMANNMMGMGGGMGMMGGNMGAMMGGGMGTLFIQHLFHSGVSLRRFALRCSQALTPFLTCRRRPRRLRQQSESIQSGFLPTRSRRRRRELEPAWRQETASGVRTSVTPTCACLYQRDSSDLAKISTFTTRCTTRPTPRS
jgi:hypothetical protein